MTNHVEKPQPFITLDKLAGLSSEALASELPSRGYSVKESPSEAISDVDARQMDYRVEQRIKKAQEKLKRKRSKGTFRGGSFVGFSLSFPQY